MATLTPNRPSDLGYRNEANGFVGINADGEIVGTVINRVDTEANLSAIVLANGELAYASDTESVFIGDGATAGGLFFLQKWQTSGRLVTPSGSISNDPTGVDFKGYAVVVKPYAEYEFNLSASFVGDTSNTSNYVLDVQTDPFLLAFDNTIGYVLRMDWYPGPGDQFLSGVLESQARSVVHPLQEAFNFVAAPLVELTRSTTELSGTFRVKTAADGATIHIKPRPRVTSPSAASCDLMVQHRRVG